MTPVVVRISGETAGQHPGPLVRNGRLPGHKDGGIRSDGGAHVVGNDERGGGVVTLDYIALLGYLGLSDGLALLGVDLGENGRPVAVVERYLETAGLGLAALAAGGERKDHDNGKRKAKHGAQLFHFLSSLT